MIELIVYLHYRHYITYKSKNCQIKNIVVSKLKRVVLLANQLGLTNSDTNNRLGEKKTILLK